MKPSFKRWFIETSNNYNINLAIHATNHEDAALIIMKRIVDKALKRGKIREIKLVKVTKRIGE